MKKLTKKTYNLCCQIFKTPRIKSNFLKSNINKAYINNIKIYIKDKKQTAQLKFHCILLLKDVSLTKNIPFMIYLEEKILKRLKDFAKLTKKSIEARAKELSFDQDVYWAQNFWQILLESMKLWGSKYTKNADGKPTKFKKFYDDLIKGQFIISEISFPTKAVYIVTQPKPEPPIAQQQQKQIPPTQKKNIDDKKEKIENLFRQIEKNVQNLKQSIQQIHFSLEQDFEKEIICSQFEDLQNLNEFFSDKLIDQMQENQTKQNSKFVSETLDLAINLQDILLCYQDFAKNKIKYNVFKQQMMQFTDQYLPQDQKINQIQRNQPETSNKNDQQSSLNITRNKGEDPQQTNNNEQKQQFLTQTPYQKTLSKDDFSNVDQQFKTAGFNDFQSFEPQFSDEVNQDLFNQFNQSDKNQFASNDNFDSEKRDEFKINFQSINPKEQENQQNLKLSIDSQHLEFKQDSQNFQDSIIQAQQQDKQNPEDSQDNQLQNYMNNGLKNDFQNEDNNNIFQQQNEILQNINLKFPEEIEQQQDPKKSSDQFNFENQNLQMDDFADFSQQLEKLSDDLSVKNIEDKQIFQEFETQHMQQHEQPMIYENNITFNNTEQKIQVDRQSYGDDEFFDVENDLQNQDSNIQIGYSNFKKNINFAIPEVQNEQESDIDQPGDINFKKILEKTNQFCNDITPVHNEILVQQNSQQNLYQKSNQFNQNQQQIVQENVKEPTEQSLNNSNRISIPQFAPIRIDSQDLRDCQTTSQIDLLNGFHMSIVQQFPSTSEIHSITNQNKIFEPDYRPQAQTLYLQQEQQQSRNYEPEINLYEQKFQELKNSYYVEVNSLKEMYENEKFENQKQIKDFQNGLKQTQHELNQEIKKNRHEIEAKIDSKIEKNINNHKEFQFIKQQQDILVGELNNMKISYQNLMDSLKESQLLQDSMKQSQLHEFEEKKQQLAKDQQQFKKEIEQKLNEHQIEQHKMANLISQASEDQNSQKNLKLLIEQSNQNDQMMKQQIMDQQTQQIKHLEEDLKHHQNVQKQEIYNQLKQQQEEQKRQLALQFEEFQILKKQQEDIKNQQILQEKKEEEYKNELRNFQEQVKQMELKRQELEMQRQFVNQPESQQSSQSKRSQSIHQQISSHQLQNNVAKQTLNVNYLYKKLNFPIISNSQQELNFKYACLMDQSVLYENEEIQIGVKCNLMQSILSLKVVYINKTEYDFNDFVCTYNNNNLNLIKSSFTNKIIARSKQFQEFAYIWQKKQLGNQDVVLNIKLQQVLQISQKAIDLQLPIMVNKFLMSQSLDYQQFNKSFVNLPRIRIEIPKVNRKLIKNLKDFNRYFQNFQIFKDFGCLQFKMEEKVLIFAKIQQISKYNFDIELASQKELLEQFSQTFAYLFSE